MDVAMQEKRVREVVLPVKNTYREVTDKRPYPYLLGELKLDKRVTGIAVIEAEREALLGEDAKKAFASISGRDPVQIQVSIVRDWSEASNWPIFDIHPNIHYVGPSYIKDRLHPDGMVYFTVPDRERELWRQSITLKINKNTSVFEINVSTKNGDFETVPAMKEVNCYELPVFNPPTTVAILSYPERSAFSYAVNYKLASLVIEKMLEGIKLRSA